MFSISPQAMHNLFRQLAVASVTSAAMCERCRVRTDSLPTRMSEKVIEDVMPMVDLRLASLLDTHV